MTKHEDNDLNLGFDAEELEERLTLAEAIIDQLTRPNHATIDDPR